MLPAATNKHILAFVLFVSFLTLGGWFSSQLMPDIFVAIMILGLCCFLLFPNSKKEQAILVVILFISVLVHNSNYVVLTLFALAVLLLSLFVKVVKPFVRKAIVLVGIGGSAWLSLCTSNWIGGNGFTGSTSTHVFVMGKLVESGILKIYLEKACPLHNYKICPYKDSLPPVAFNFHWDANSPLQKTGGWAANKTEYNTIIADIFSRPKYYPLIAYKSIEGTARQLALYEIDGSYSLPWAKFDAGTAPYEAVKQYFPHELNQLFASRMNDKTFNIPFLNNLFYIILILSSIMALFLFSFCGENKKEIVIILIIFCTCIFLNSYVTALLSSINSRFNSRVFWLIPLFNSIVIYKAFNQFYLKLKNKLQ
jgi:hypothetical protein